MLKVHIKKQLSDFCLEVSFESQTKSTDEGGEILALLGASGCGKTMTLKCIAGIEKPDEGYIILNDKVLFDSGRGINLPPQKRRVGYLFQQYALFPNMSVKQNIIAGIRSLGLSKAETEKRADDRIKSMKLSGLENKRPGELSGGQQQRVALARILVNEPELLLLDEPFSALDSFLRWQMEIELCDTLKESGYPAVFVSHSREEVYRICDSVCAIADGKSDSKVTVKEFFNNPVTLTACKLSGCKNFSKISLKNGEIFAEDWGFTVNAAAESLSDKNYIGLRSHSIYLSLAKTEEDNSVLCRLLRVIDDVFSTVIMLRCDGAGANAELIRVETEKKDFKPFEGKDKLYINFTKESVMLLR